MERNELVGWLRQHPDTVHGRPEAALERCEAEVRRHAAEDAWRRAHAIAERRRAEWERSFGFQASEAFVARELCHRFAEQLSRSEPQLRPGDEDRLGGQALLEGFEPEARAAVRAWVHELGEAEERRTWREIVRFTDRRGDALVREAHLSAELDLDASPTYPETAARVTALLMRDYEAHL